jgi:hypothetical protein
MRPLELAHKYMAAFFGEAPLEAMTGLLADKLHFEGPFYTFETAHDYIASLQENPPKDVSYTILNEYEDDGSACLIYEFRKPCIEVLMAQYFKATDDKITKIRLIFDTNKFK